MDLNDIKQRMYKALEVLKNDMATIRTGRAMPSLVETISVMVYGGTTRMKIMELATISASDPQTLLLTPFDPSVLGEIQKGIMEANVGLTPTTDGNNIRIAIPSLSQERREQLIHLMKQKLENGRVMVRQVRHEAMHEIKKLEASEDEIRKLEKETQEITDNVISEIDSLGKKKEEELLQI